MQHHHKADQEKKQKKNIAIHCVFTVICHQHACGAFNVEMLKQNEYGWRYCALREDVHAEHIRVHVLRLKHIYNKKQRQVKC